jgi:tetratricopeptide (TPR) repeat protein
MGECGMHLGNYKDAIHYFTIVVKQRPRNLTGWEALIKCLYTAEYFEEAIEQSKAALKSTDGKPIFYFYYSSSLFGINKTKEALLQLEKGMEKAPKLLKKFVELNPAILQNNQVVDLIARYKKGRRT